MYASIQPTGDNSHVFAAELRSVGKRVRTYGPPAVRQSAKDLQGAVRRHASGRPGPEIVTGAYIQSIKVSNGGIGGSTYNAGVARGTISMGFESEVYSDAPQARRLELGFVGVDSLGRHYNQPPFPHWAPAIAETDLEFFLRMERVLEASLPRKRR